MKYRNVIFDVDGTLWDSSEQVAEAWNMVLARQEDTRHIVLTREDEYRFMGHTMDEIAEMMMPELEQDRRMKIMRVCMVEENRYLTDHSGVFYPGLRETISGLRDMGLRLYIVSNCQDGYIQTLLRCGGFTCDPAAPDASDFCDFECFGRTGHGKSDNIELLLSRDFLVKAESVYIGDTAMDEAASRSAGIAFIRAAYGFGNAEAPDAAIHDIRELPELLPRL